MAMSGVDGTGRVPADFPSPPRGPGRICRSPDDGRRGAPATWGRGTAPPAALPPVSEPPEMRSPGATYRACKPENRQRINSSFGAMVPWNVGLRVRGLGPRAASSGSGLASAGSPCPRCLRCRRTWRDSGAGPPRRDRCGLWRPAAPPTAGGSARGSAWLTRDTRSPRRTAPARAPAPGPRSQQAGAGGCGRSLAQKTRGPQQPTPP